jgi:hypothetical protein
MEFGEAIYDVICAYDFDKNLDASETEDEDSDAEEEGALEADNEGDSNEGLAGEDTEGSGSEEEEVVVPRKRARMAGAPSRVPVLVAESQTRARQ